MKKKKSRFLFILLFIVLLPIILIELIFKSLNKIRLNRKKKNGKFNDRDFYESLEINKVDIMDGIAFEQFLKRLFIYKGYQVCETARTGDFGADLVLNKDGRKTVVQAKRYNNNVGAKALQEIYSARHHYKADYMMVVSNSHFTRQAEVMAEEQDITLIDREELIGLINEVKSQLQENMDSALEGELNREFQEMEEGNFKYRI